MKFFLLLLLSLFPLQAFAYIGPGLGMGTIAIVLGVFFTIIMVFFSIVWYPFKRLLKKFRNKRTETDQGR